MAHGNWSNIAMINHVLDHGYIKLVESWGSDKSIVEAARMSTGKGFLGWGGEPPRVKCEECRGRGYYWSACNGPYEANCQPCNGSGLMDGKTEPGDEKLLRYLWEHKHATPFEMAGMTIEVQAPIFVFREWHRHRTQSYNEASGRYAPLPDVNYIPSLERLTMGSSGGNKQAGAIADAASLTEEAAMQYRRDLAESYAAVETLYQRALHDGVPKELARVHLPVGRYSRMRASANLRNWLAFMTLRSTAKNQAAQWEIRQYADALGALLTEAFPRTMALFSEGT